MPSAAPGQHGGRAVLHVSEDRGRISGGAILCDPRCLTGELVDSPQIVPAGLLIRTGILRFHVQDRIAVENWLVLLVERIRFAPGFIRTPPDLLPLEIPAAHLAAGIEEPDVLAIGDRRSGKWNRCRHTSSGWAPILRAVRTKVDFACVRVDRVPKNCSAGLRRT